MKNQRNKAVFFQAALVAVATLVATFQVGAAPPGDTPRGNAVGHTGNMGNSAMGNPAQHPRFRPVNPDFSGYSQPFSALGEPKNVIVKVRENGDLTKSYLIRSRYHNNTEQVRVDGVMTVPPLIARYDFVQVDQAGNVTYVNVYTETPATEDYLNYSAENADLDLSSFEKIILDDTWSESWNCNGGGAVSTCDWIGSISGTPVQNNYWVSVYSPLGAGTINGIAFNDLRGETNTYTSDTRYRVRAKGIGEVLRQDSFRPQVLVYYRVNGATGGSLEGTPFASGALLDGVLF